MSDQSDDTTLGPLPKYLPAFTVVITTEAMNAAIRKKSHACVIADAVKLAKPHVIRIQVDTRELRFTDPAKKIRYIYDMPGTGRSLLVHFDRGIRPPQTRIRFSRGHALRSKQKDPRTGKPHPQAPFSMAVRPDTTVPDTLGGDPGPRWHQGVQGGPSTSSWRSQYDKNGKRYRRNQRIFGTRQYTKDDVIPEDRGPGVFATDEEIAAANQREQLIVAETRRRAEAGEFDLPDNNGNIEPPAETSDPIGPDVGS